MSIDLTSSSTGRASKSAVFHADDRAFTPAAGSRSRALAIIAVASILTCVACSGGDEPGGIREAGVDSAPAADSTSTADSAVACGAAEVTGPVIVAEGTPVRPPAATGGIIADGTYVLTRLVLFSELDPDSSVFASIRLRHTLVLKGATFEEAYQQDGSKKTQYRSGTAALAAATLRLTASCGTSGGVDSLFSSLGAEPGWSFTAAPTELTLVKTCGAERCASLTYIRHS